MHLYCVILTMQSGRSLEATVDDILISTDLLWIMVKIAITCSSDHPAVWLEPKYPSIVDQRVVLTGCTSRAFPFIYVIQHVQSS